MSNDHMSKAELNAQEQKEFQSYQAYLKDANKPSGGNADFFTFLTRQRAMETENDLVTERLQLYLSLLQHLGNLGMHTLPRRSFSLLLLTTMMAKGLLCRA